MGKIVVEDLTDPKTVRERFVENLANSTYFATVQSGFASGMSLEEIVISVLLTAADIEIYSKAVGLLDESKLETLKAKALEMAVARQKSLEDRGLADMIRKHVADSKERPDGKQDK